MVQTCPGCKKVIHGGEQAFSRHTNGCSDYNEKFSAVPGRMQAPSAAAASTSAAVPAPAAVSYSLEPKAPKRRKKKQGGREGPIAPPGAQHGTAGQSSASNEPLSTIAETEMDVIEEPVQDERMPDPSPPPAQSPPPRERHERPNRSKLPARFVQDTLPEGPAPLSDSDEPEEPDAPSVPRRVLQVGSARIRLDTTRTKENSFGVSRRYYGRPTSVPDAFTPLESMLADREHPTESAADSQDQPELPLADRIAAAIEPYPNVSSWLLNKHYWSADRKSQEDRHSLIHNVLLHELFDTEELRRVNFKALDEQLGRMDIDDPEAVLGRGWKKSTVRVEVPHGQKTSPPAKEACMFDAPGVLHRSIATLVREEFSKPSAAAYHYTPFTETWTNPATGEKEKMYSEMFSSEAFINAHNELQDSPPEPGCDLPRAIAGLCLMSDSAHLTDTGNAHIHPFNVAFANESMYSRGKPSNHSVHPVMHLPALSDTDLMTFAEKLHGKGKAKGNALFTQCRREYFQGALKVLFDKDFWDAYAHGIVVDCADGVRRRLYLRLFVYSADYPEKVLVATIRDGGGCPCPRCLVKHKDLAQMGTADDLQSRETQRRVDDRDRQAKVRRARQFLRQGYAATYAGIDKELKEESYVPVENAFTVQDGNIRLNVFDLLVVDLMHEIELGVWVALLAHLIRILYAIDPDKVRQLNVRYRAVPTFGRDIIRQFSDHVTDMTRMTAHEYANMLECAPPCFEGLFGEWDDEIQSLLFTLARWHSLAKLRLHTESTLLQLRHLTCEFGDAIRKFQTGCCEAFNTVETESEKARRVARAQAAAAKTGSGSARPAASTTASGGTVPAEKTGERQPRKFTVDTYKFHSMGDYASSISNLGSTYNYTTAINELSHRSPIAAYQRSNKRNYESQIVKVENIRAAHRDIQTRLDKLNAGLSSSSAAKKRSDEDDEIVGDGTPHHEIAADESNPLRLKTWLRSMADDEAYEDFEDKLRCHILARLKNETDVTKRYPKWETAAINILGDRIFSHARLRVNYTTYDMRRAQDCVNCNSRKCNVMVLADEGEDSNDPLDEGTQHSPFWYARVVGIYHARIYHPILTKKGPKIVKFLWVRWLGADPGWKAGWAAHRLDRIGYVPASESDAFGFLNPRLVLRACHLIPGHAHGMTMELLAPSVHSDSKEGDYRYYYVNRFPDCDMMQRFTGLGIGHTSNRTPFPDKSEPEEWASDAVSYPSGRPDEPGTSTSTSPTTSQAAQPSHAAEVPPLTEEGDTEEVRDPERDWIFG